MKKFFNLFLVSLIATLFSGCTKIKKYEYNFTEEFFIPVNITILTSKTPRSDLKKKLRDEVVKINKEFNPYDENSSLFKLNKEKKLTVSSEFLKLFSVAKSIGKDYTVENKRNYQLTIFSLFKLWDFNNNYYDAFMPKEGSVPNSEKIKAVLKFIDDEKVVISGNEVNLLENFSLDFGSLAKGYLCDKLKRVLEENEIKSGIIDAGGNLYLVGKNIVSKKGFKTKIRLPEENNFFLDEQTNYLGTLFLENVSVVTSGSYERFIKVGNTTYHHILNPYTGYPIGFNLESKTYEPDSLVSVTVFSESSLNADALSTALFCLGTKNALNKIKENNLKTIIVNRKKEVYVSSGLKDAFIFNEKLKAKGYSLKNA